MNILRFFFWFWLGMIISGYKMIKMLVYKAIGRSQDREDFFDNWFGLTDPALDSEWDRISSDEPKTHTLTNIVVEWNRLEAQRGAKAFCGVILIKSVVIAILAALLIFA